MFSRRTPASLAPNPLTEALARRRAAGLPVVDLTRTNPTRCGLALPDEEILAALGDARALPYEPEPRGWVGAREAVAAHHAVQGGRADPARVFLTSSTSEAYAWVFKLLCDPGDEVLVPQPSYPLFDCLAALEGIAARGYRLCPELDWAVDREGLEAALTPRTRAILVVNPNNPTGSYVHDEDWRYLEDLAARRGVALVSDEVFFDYLLASDAPARTALSLEGEALVFTLSGLSKIAALPQMKLGWLHVGGPEALVRAAMERLEWIADAYLPVSAAVQYAAPRWLAVAPRARAAVLERCRAVAAVMAETLGEAAGGLVAARRVEGGWSAVIEGPSTLGGVDLAVGLVKERGVLIQPGYFYDFEGEGKVVFSLLTPAGEARTGLAALSDFWATHSVFR